MRRDGVSVSTALTSILHRRCTSGRNRSIPTILAGCVDGGLVDVSAVDTEAVALIDSAGSRWPSQVPHPGACRTFPCRASSGSRAGTRRPGFNAQFRARTPSQPESTNGHEGGAELIRRGTYRTVPRQPTNQCLRCHDIRNSQKS